MSCNGNFKHRISSSGWPDDRFKCNLYYRDSSPPCVFLPQPGLYTCFEVSSISRLALKKMMMTMIVNMVMIMIMVMVMIIDQVP